MREAASMGAFIEFVGNAVAGTLKSAEFSSFAAAMREAGVEHCILSSDFGQKGNLLHPDGLEQVFAGLRKAGLPEADIDRMAKVNPARLLNLK
jgi:microsomal dipeptidase-like Zn-dependent dipeptidase